VLCLHVQEDLFETKEENLRLKKEVEELRLAVSVLLFQLTLAWNDICNPPSVAPQKHTSGPAAPTAVASDVHASKLRTENKQLQAILREVSSA